MVSMPCPEQTPLTPAERRARREARRTAQRAANVGRGAKMHEARLAWERAPELRRANNEAGIGPYHIGCSGWYYWHWQGGFYPAELPRARWFRFYSEQFDTVELNAPFYSWPTIATVRGWLKQAESRRFIYTVKVCELITHVKRFTGTKTLVRDFGHIADLLGDRMGCFLFQLPPSFRYTAPRLRRIAEQLDPTRRNVVEFRHASWWNEKVFTTFRERGIIFCSCSGPRLPDELVRTADEIYLRFHGPHRWYRHDYTSDELAEWARRIRASGVRRVWAYFNNDRDCYAISNARELRRQLRA
jgi:uncharacterized protein YecE (DUF72 family)